MRIRAPKQQGDMQWTDASHPGGWGVPDVREPYVKTPRQNAALGAYVYYLVPKTNRSYRVNQGLYGLYDPRAQGYQDLNY